MAETFPHPINTRFCAESFFYFTYIQGHQAGIQGESTITCYRFSNTEEEYVICNSTWLKSAFGNNRWGEDEQNAVSGEKVLKNLFKTILIECVSSLVSLRWNLEYLIQHLSTFASYKWSSVKITAFTVYTVSWSDIDCISGLFHDYQKCHVCFILLCLMRFF